jgi:hypothetical protein
VVCLRVSQRLLGFAATLLARFSTVRNRALRLNPSSPLLLALFCLLPLSADVLDVILFIQRVPDSNRTAWETK